METKIFKCSMVLLFGSVPALADYGLAGNGKKVICYADDNQTFVLNAKRTTIKYTVEGESLRARIITKTITDGKQFVTYITKQGRLRLSDQGDTYAFTDESEFAINCE